MMSDETGDVRLREVREDDLPVFFEHQRDPDANAMAAFPARDREAFLAHWTKILSDDTGMKMTVLFGGRVAGNVVSWEQSGVRKIGYWIGKEYWGRGIATRAVSQFLRLETARPLHAHVAKRNVASIRVLQKCGFTITGDARVPADETGEEIEELLLTLGQVQEEAGAAGRRSGGGETMTVPGESPAEALAREVRIYVFRHAAETARVPQPPEISAALGRPLADVQEALKRLAAGKVLILAPNDGNIWAANPFCAVPSGFRVEAGGKTYWGICIWDALGIAAALGKDALISAPCGDCGEALRLEVRNRDLSFGEGVVHFAVAAHHWWDNIGFT